MVPRMNFLSWQRILTTCRPPVTSSSSSPTSLSSSLQTNTRYYSQCCSERFHKSHCLTSFEQKTISSVVKALSSSSYSTVAMWKKVVLSLTEKTLSTSGSLSSISSKFYLPSSTSSFMLQKPKYSTVATSGITEINQSNAKDLLSRYDAILLDCDGVLWKTDHVTPIPGIPEVMKQLREMGKKIFFVTNNSMLSRGMCFEKFSYYDIDPGSKENVYCVAYSAAIYLRDVLKVTGCVYNAGSLGMERELTLAGLENIGTGPDPDKPSQEIEDLLNMYFRNDVQAVVVGFDEYFSYTKLYKAASYLSNRDCHFVVTSGLGSGVLIGPNRFQPFTGPIVSAVMTASRREPILIGKPDSHMFESIMMTQPEVDKGRCLMIGDSLKADIGFAKASGIDSALVLTGSSCLADVKDYPGMEPEFYMESLSNLIH